MNGTAGVEGSPITMDSPPHFRDNHLPILPFSPAQYNEVEQIISFLYQVTGVSAGKPSVP